MALTRLGPNQAINLASNTTGTLGVANGGTGLTSGTSGQFLKFTGSTTVASAAGGGITEADQYRLTSTFNGSANPITGTWERNDTVFDKIGTGMSVSSGNFTFPSTGIYKVEFNSLFSKSSGDTQYVAAKINITTNNSSYSLRATGYGFINEAGGETYSGATCQTIIDVTDTSNVKVKFTAGSIASGSKFQCTTTYNQTCFTFIRLADT